MIDFGEGRKEMVILRRIELLLVIEVRKRDRSLRSKFSSCERQDFWVAKKWFSLIWTRCMVSHLCLMIKASIVQYCTEY